MTGHRYDHDDSILPVKIEHNCEELWDGDQLEQRYNYLVYEFETEQRRYRARSYLDENHLVSIVGPFDKASAKSLPEDDLQIDARVLAYLRRRYSRITRLGPEGYVEVE